MKKMEQCALRAVAAGKDLGNGFYWNEEMSKYYFTGFMPSKKFVCGVFYRETESPFSGALASLPCYEGYFSLVHNTAKNVTSGIKVYFDMAFLPRLLLQQFQND